MGFGVYFPQFPELSECGRCGGGEEPTALRGELWAVWRALVQTPGREVEVVTDSMGVVRGYPKAMGPWLSSNYDHIPQGDIWREIGRAGQGRLVTVRWVKAHGKGGNPDQQGNSQADRLAQKGRKGGPDSHVVLDKGPLVYRGAREDLPTTAEILEALNGMNQKGAPGMDGISARDLQERREALVETGRTGAVGRWHG